MISCSLTSGPPPRGMRVISPNPLSLTGGVRFVDPAACCPSAYMSGSCLYDFLGLRGAFRTVGSGRSGVVHEPFRDSS